MIDHSDVHADKRFSSLRALATETPESKIGRIRWIWPEIAAALRAGHSVRAVWQRLHADGLQISYNLLTGYISRLRREEAQPSQPGGPSATAAPGAGKPGGRGSSDGGNAAHDPASNLRERLDRMQGFDYSGTVKKEDLI